MENQVFRIENQTYKSMMVTNDELWMTSKKINNPTEFQEVINNGGRMTTSLVIPLKDIYEIIFNDVGTYVFLKYLNDSTKKKEVSFGLDDGEMAESFTTFLGGKTDLNKEAKAEGTIRPLLSNILYVLLAGGATFLFGIFWDEDDMSSGGSRKSRGGKAILRMAYEYVGQTGILIIGSLLTLYLIYLLVKRLKNPAKEIHYSK